MNQVWLGHRLIPALVTRVVILLALIAPVVAQNESRPYFSLSTAQTFGTHDRPAIALSGVNVDAVQIRVYRVNDPVEFYRRLENPHTFGSEMPRPAGKQSLLETIHSWKRRLRASIRRELRAQFTESPSAHFRRREKPRPEKTARTGTYYAQAPVLNQEQLVLSFVQPVSSTTRWNSQQVAIGVKDKGVYLIEAVHGALRAYTILTVSDIVLVTKIGREHALGFVADRYTGEPLPQAELVSTERNGKPAALKVNGDGMAEIALAQSSSEGTRLIARRGSDVAFSEIPSYAYAAGRANWTGYVYTDRPVYRPGDTMHFRGILRTAQTTGYTVPANQEVAVQITDADGKSVYQKSLTTSTNGIIHDEYSLPRASALGAYFIQVKAGESNMSGNFDVEEYKKPEYEVRVMPAKTRVLEGDPVEAVIDARYYFGEPVDSGTVKYTVYRSRYWFPLWGEPDEDVEQQEGFQDESNSEQILESQGKLDADGKLTIRFKSSVSEHKFDFRYRIEARVTDQARREIAGTGWVIATYGSFVLDVQPRRYFTEPSSTEAFAVSARDYDGKPVSTDVHFELAEWNPRKRSTSGASVTANVHTDAQGAATASVTIPARGGSYRARVTARDSEGRELEATSFVWVAGAQETLYFGSGPRSLEIVPEKKTYRPGETAHILVVAGQANTPVLVTVEGRDIRLKKLLRSKSGTVAFDYPVASEEEPAFFISAVFLRNGELFTGTKRVKVPPEDHKLAVKLTTDKPQYLPGQTATYNVNVTGMDGKPVAKADLSLGVVDEAIYAIRPDRTPDIVNFFFGQDWNSVYTDSSLQYFFSGEAGTRRMELAALRPGSTLAQLKPEHLVQPKVRKAFPDTAFWAADLTTDAEGHAQTRVTFPDSLTTWRATARGATTDERFGSGQLKTIVRKNLILRLAVPRFFVQGDEVVISAIVHNYLQSAKKARVSLAVKGLEVMSGSIQQDVEVASRGEARIDWRVKALTIRQASVTGQALTDEESDALELDLPVNPPGVSVRQAHSGSLQDTAAARFDLNFPREAQPASRSISIRLSPSIASSLFGALDFLTSYPYGCVEQTMSSFLPDLMVSKAVNELHLSQPLDEPALREKINAGLDRLYGFQHEDGGWGWWESDATHPFMTAYVVAGLAEAQKAGISVKPDSLDRGVRWLTARNSKPSDDAPDLQAYELYSLATAGQGQKDAVERLYGERSQLSSYGLALLGLTLEQAKDSPANEIAASLERSAQQNDAEAWWPATRDEMLDFEADATPEATAYAMKFLSHERSNSTVLPKAALWLVNHRNEGYWWSSTKQTAMVIYGLIDYLKTSNELHPDITAKVLVNGQTVSTAAFTTEPNGSPTEIVLDDSKLQQGNNRVEIDSSGRGRVYYSATALHYSNEAHMQRQGAVSLNILRDYFTLKPGREGDRIVYDLAPLSGPVASGDTIAVRLTITGSDWKYLMTEDPIPAGTEFIERDNLYEIRNKPPWWRYWFTRREFHDNRMALFQTRFQEGQQQYFYLLKVVNPGVFRVGPARVGPMYQPWIQATTEGRTLEVK
jgi:hypothetical protein